ncbi:AAA family ATPase [Eubacterium sp.]|uniref:AAA family ATPase n=1 Tax=Eubacterium sp. TaxID=142586 RepID=UPI0025EA6B41|nr:AAA family ATPase [Eubacterium sp.]MCR5629589.1 ATP-binding protein [Eubacterium sp.]
MIIMDIRVDNFFAFKDFHMNMSYPKKIVDSTIKEEYLVERPNFRYKKVNVIMGANATGKTSLGRVLMLFTNYLNDGSFMVFTDNVTNIKKEAKLKIDFVTDTNDLYRFDLKITPKKGENYTEDDVNLQIYYTPILVKDNYELCEKRLDANKCRHVKYNMINVRGWSFSYPFDVVGKFMYRPIMAKKEYVYILEQILKTLDPSITRVIKSEEVDDTFIIFWDNCSVYIKEGMILEESVMSSGTKAGLRISYIIASLLFDMHDLYYSDELFSFVNSDIEKACLSVIIDKLEGRKQIFFTTHNSDILDMQLPKHSFVFLKKNSSDEECPIKCISASDYLKRNTDSLKNAVENDLFCTAPELNRIYEIAEL